MSESKPLLIVYHSQSGSCAKIAQAAYQGAHSEVGAGVQVLRAWDACTADLAGASGLILVAAENSGALSGGIKDFLDRTFYPAIAADLMLPYTLLLSAGMTVGAHSSRPSAFFLVILFLRRQSQ